MKIKNVLGLDIGTNSIGGALIKLPENIEDYGIEGKIEWIGSRILPDSDYKKAFEIGQTKSASVLTPTANRRQKRGARRLKQRYKLRRNRLIAVFKALEWIKEDFPIDFKKAKRNNENFKFAIGDYLPFGEKTINEFEEQFGIQGEKSKKKGSRKGGKSVIPEDWIVYFLRKKALTDKIEIFELARIIYILNQRRGFKSSRKDLKDTNILPYDEFVKRKEKKDYGEMGIETRFVCITKIKTITIGDEKKDNKGRVIGNEFKIEPEDKRMEIWYETKKNRPEWDIKGETFTFLVTQKIDKNGKFTQLKPQTPTDENWALCTTALDEKIQQVDNPTLKHPGAFFYNELLEAYKEGRNYKIRQYPVYRWRYKEELKAIWTKQCELNPELHKINADKVILKKLFEVLYPTQAKNNLPKLKEFTENDLLHIISNDIIYYQRELKSQKNSISECRYEKRIGKEKEENGNWIETGKYGLKCIPKSSPIFQEFRIWQDIHNIKILKREEKIDGKTKLDVDFTKKYISREIKEEIYKAFIQKASINEKDILEIISKNNESHDIVIEKKATEHSHRINLYANRESLKGNETLLRYKSLFKRVDYDGERLLNDSKILFKLWHIDYSITSSDIEKSEKGIRTALTNILPELPNKETVIQEFLKLSEFKKEYGSYSAMAIKKLLPLMRVGKFWNEAAIQEKTKERIQKIIDGEYDELVNSETRDKIIKWEKENRPLNSITDYYGLPTWLAGYLVYGIHSENEYQVCKNAEEFNNKVVLKLKNNSLRNPVVEQVVRETLLIVRDIWKHLESTNEKIDEIHIELGRELKNNTDERKKFAETQNNNFKEKLRIKALLKELINDGFSQVIDEESYIFSKGKFDFKTKVEKTNFEVNPNPDSPNDIEKFRIWESMSKKTDFDWDKKVKDEKIPTEQSIKKYILWRSQDCRSPYTGKIIPLSKLFDPNQYEIEHIIPRAKMKNDSMNNLVISEWGVNKAKGNQLAANFISDSKGKCTHGGREYKLFTLEEYETYCNEVFKFNKTKRKNLLATEVPDGFVERQLNDTRFITKIVAQLLKPVVGSETKIIFTGGSITSELKKNWGLNKEWKKLLLPRFERLEKITGQTYIKTNENDRNDIDINVPENEKLELKRIDHRHHALDALIIAATTREHIRYLNSLNAVDTNAELKKVKQSLVKGKIREFKLPWETFTKEAREKLEETIVSFKVNNKIISKPKNLYTVWGDDMKKIKKEQKPNNKWMSVRKSMFKLPQGIIHLKDVYEEKNIYKAIEIQIERMRVQNKPEMRIASYVYDKEARQTIKKLIEQIGISIEEKESLLLEIKKYLRGNPLRDFAGKEYKAIKIAYFEEYASKRVNLDNSFDHKKIDKIPYAKLGKSTLGKLLHEHLDSEDSRNEKGVADPTKAFSNEGLEILAKKAGMKINKVTIYEKKDESSKFGKQYVEVDAGSNSFFVLYENNTTKERSGYESIPTHKAIEKLVNGEQIAEDKEGYTKIILSPGDLVYVPTKDERERIINGIEITEVIDWENLKKIFNQTYKMVSCTEKECHFIPFNLANPIIDTTELGANNKSEKAWDGEIIYTKNSKDKITRANSGSIIKASCIKIKVDRLGHISLT